MTPFYDQAGVTLHHGDCFEVLSQLPAESVQTCVTSPPYWALRDYGVKGQLGLEPTPDEYVENMVHVFREVRRVLRDDGTLWLNMGDSYAGAPGGNDGRHAGLNRTREGGRTHRKKGNGLKPKDMVGMPWRLALALQRDGWWLRCDIIWHKPTPMPEAVKDRPTKAHEYIFLLSKAHRYYYDADAIKEPVTGRAHSRGNGVNPKAECPTGWDTGPGDHRGKTGRYPKSKQNESFSRAISKSGNLERKAPSARGCPAGTGKSQAGSIPWEGTHRNKRSVWTVQSTPFTGAHFATFPPKLIEPCILAGARAGDVVLDPFAGAGTTALVARALGRRFVGAELSEDYCRIITKRLEQGVLNFGEAS